MNPLRFALEDLVAHIESLGYVKVKGEITLHVNYHSDDSINLSYYDLLINLSYYDLLDEYHSFYLRRAADQTDGEWMRDARIKVGSIPPARDALRANAATMVAKVRQKLLDAGFDGEVWMAELDQIVKTLSSNAITQD